MRRKNSKVVSVDRTKEEPAGKWVQQRTVGNIHDMPQVEEECHVAEISAWGISATMSRPRVESQSTSSRVAWPNSVRGVTEPQG